MPKSVLRRGLEGFHPYVPGEQPPDAEGWIKLNTNESPLPPSPKVLDAIKQAADESLRLYPSPTARPAREAIARHFGLDASWVAVGNGGDEMIELCFRAFAGPGETVAFPTPTYPLFEPLCRIHAVEPSRHETEDFSALPASLDLDPSRLKFIVNPNSPTGALFHAKHVENVVASSSGVVVIDEAYVDFAHRSAVDLLKRYENVMLLRTFSKSYSLAGMRIGFALGSPDLVEALDAVKDSYNLDRLAIVAAVAAIGDESHHQKIVEEVVENRTELAAGLEELKFVVSPSSANFVFVQPPMGTSALRLSSALRERKILVRHYDREPIAGWIRVTVGTKEQHEALLAALKEIV